MKRVYFTTNDIALFDTIVIVMNVDAMTHRTKQGMNEMSRNNKSIAFPCVLKTIINDAHKSNKSFTLNDKQIRSRLRAKFNDAHIKNTSWIATNKREYDAIRCAFDATYAQSMTRKPRTNKRATSTNVDVVEA